MWSDRADPPADSPSLRGLVAGPVADPTALAATKDTVASPADDVCRTTRFDSLVVNQISSLPAYPAPTLFTSTTYQ